MRFNQVTARRGNSQRRRSRRRGAAVVEFAVCLPFLIFVFLGVIDFCRVFYGVLTTSNCARNAGYEACDPNSGYTSPYANLTAAAHADFDSNWSLPSSALTFSSTSTGSTTNADGTTNMTPVYTTVDCRYSFSSISQFPGLPATGPVDRFITVRIAPAAPAFQ